MKRAPKRQPTSKNFWRKVKLNQSIRHMPSGLHIMCVGTYTRCKTSLQAAQFILNTNTLHQESWKSCSTLATFSYQGTVIVWFSVTAASVTLFSRDPTKGQFWGSLTEKPHLFSTRALKTKGLQERMVGPKNSKDNRYSLTKGWFGRVRLRY